MVSMRASQSTEATLSICNGEAEAVARDAIAGNGLETLRLHSHASVFAHRLPHHLVE